MIIPATHCRKVSKQKLQKSMPLACARLSRGAPAAFGGLRRGKFAPLRNPGIYEDSPGNANKKPMVSTMVSKWCEMDFATIHGMAAAQYDGTQNGTFGKWNRLPAAACRSLFLSSHIKRPVVALAFFFYPLALELPDLPSTSFLLGATKRLELNQHAAWATSQEKYICTSSIQYSHSMKVASK